MSMTTMVCTIANIEYFIPDRTRVMSTAVCIYYGMYNYKYSVLFIPDSTEY